MAGTTRVTFTYADVFGDQWSFTLYVAPTVLSPTDAPIPALVTAINACLHCINLRVEISKATNFAGALSAQAYPTVQDKALMVITDTNGDTHKWQIPGPANELLDSNGRTVDVGTGTEGEAWKDYVLANFHGRGGQALGTFVKGYRTMARRLNKE